MHLFVKCILSTKIVHVSDSSSVHHLGVFHCTHVLILLASCQLTCMTYTIAVCTVKNS